MPGRPDTRDCAGLGHRRRRGRGCHLAGCPRAGPAHRRAAPAGWSWAGPTCCSAWRRTTSTPTAPTVPACDADLVTADARRPHAHLSRLRPGVRCRAGRPRLRPRRPAPRALPDSRPGRTHPGGPARAASGGRLGVTMRPQDLTRGGGFEVLRRFAKARVPVERCDLCGVEVAPMHDHLIDPVRAPARLRLWRLRGALQRAGRHQVQAGAPARDGARRAHHQRCPVGGAPAADRPGLLLRQHAAGAGGGVLPEPGRRHRVAAGARDLGGDPARAPGPRATCSPTFRRCSSTGSGAARRPTVCYLVPIDQCFRLVGIIRMHWKGFTGGTAVWEEIDRFFADLGRMARPARQGIRA